jgi:DNA replication protein DnaC
MAMIVFRQQPRELDEQDRERSRIPRLLWDAKLEKVSAGSPQREMLEKYLHNLETMLREGVGLYLSGDFSVGKSSCAAIVGKAVMAHGGTALFVSTDDIKDWYIEHTRFDEDYSMVERMILSDLLILDNLGEEPDKEYSGSRIVRIVRVRVESRKPTVITTNLKSKPFIERYGQRLTEVMKGAFLSAHAEGPNFRQQRKDGLDAWAKDLKSNG